jgi:hypothetical protein
MERRARAGIALTARHLVAPGGLRGLAGFPLKNRRGRAPSGTRRQLRAFGRMTSRRLMQLIEVAATRSGHPNFVFAAISLVVSALTILTLRSLIGLWGAL